ncbi:hypothetical protein B6N60_01765 [Richelia sinica FACHB-800]|uniref:Uncharacterized protein n=1 Tax=Richelia sinica FACHB-800 TaxID=1357546 RepID=A0A975T6E0_9NOST|nr:hypothetical protein B6N60_01765 [Richelia sinica FACHB-800]
MTIFWHFGTQNQQIWDNIWLWVRKSCDFAISVIYQNNNRAIG